MWLGSVVGVSAETVALFRSEEIDGGALSMLTADVLRQPPLQLKMGEFSGLSL